MERGRSRNKGTREAMAMILRGEGRSKDSREKQTSQKEVAKRNVDARLELRRKETDLKMQRTICV